MQKIGTVDRIRQGNFCFIKVLGEPDHFAHWTDFLDPKSDMKRGTQVCFIVKTTNKPVANPRATDVRAA